MNRIVLNEKYAVEHENGTMKFFRFEHQLYDTNLEFNNIVLAMVQTIERLQEKLDENKNSVYMNREELVSMRNMVESKIQWTQNCFDDPPEYKTDFDATLAEVVKCMDDVL